MDKKVELKTGSWLYNAGMLGLYNILKYKEEDVKISQEGISFSLDALEGLEESYFEYMIEKYWDTLSISKIVSFENSINLWEYEDYKNFDDKSLETLNNQIENVKKYIKSNSYKSAYDLINSDFDPLLNEKKIKKINLKKNENIKDRIEEIKEQVNSIKEIIEYFSLDDSKKYIGAKNVIYTYIRNAWKGVSILNSQNKNPDMYDEIANYFIKPAIEFESNYDEENSKYKYLCMSCNCKIKSLENDIGFIREMGFDTNRKTSHVYNFNNYVGICPVCKLVYSCIPAGFVYAYNRGIFVNASTDFNLIVNINNKIKDDIKNSTKQATSVYSAIQNTMNEKINQDTRYELSDMQLIRYFRDIDNDKVKYTFNILNKAILNVIKNVSSKLDKIKFCNFDEGNNTIYIYNEVINNLFDNRNNFLLIHKMLYYKLSNLDKSRYSYNDVYKVININNEYLKEIGSMKENNSAYLHYSREAGKILRNRYISMEADGKLDAIAYKMLNALKTSNRHAFMDVLLKSSMYAKIGIDSIFTRSMEDDLKFKNAGYAFVSGLLGNTKEDDKKEESNIEELGGDDE